MSQIWSSQFKKRCNSQVPSLINCLLNKYIKSKKVVQSSGDTIPKFQINILWASQVCVYPIVDNGAFCIITNI